MIGIVSRFAAQKGFDLIAQIMDRLAREEMIIVALGNGDKQYEEMFLRAAKSSFHRRSRSRSLTTMRWRTRSKLAATCS